MSSHEHSVQAVPEMPCNLMYSTVLTGLKRVPLIEYLQKILAVFPLVADRSDQCYLETITILSDV